MFERMKAGWRLAKQVRHSVSKDRTLYLFPILSGLVGVFLFAMTFLALFISFPVGSSGSDYLYLLGFILAYIIVGFFSTYFLMSMLIAYRAYAGGNSISFRSAMSQGWEFKTQILEWAVFYTILVMILRVIESRFRGIVQLLVATAGSLMIAMATFFAVPAILNNKVGPIKAVEESVSTIKKNFGPTFGGVAYVDLYTLIFTLGGFLIILLFIFLSSSVASLLIMISGIAAGLIIMAFGLILNYTYLNVLKLVLFDYVNGKGLPEGFNEVDIKNAIRRKAREIP
ncbi:MAG: DUF6159 family protein [Thermoplasmataceae archaeon]